MSNKSFKIGVAGAGVMGSGIAQVMALSGCEVTCHDIDEGVLKAASKMLILGVSGLKALLREEK